MLFNYDSRFFSFKLEIVDIFFLKWKEGVISLSTTVNSSYYSVLILPQIFFYVVVVVEKKKKVVVKNSHGEKLVGILHGTGSSELVIICHGFRSTKVFDLVLTES